MEQSQAKLRNLDEPKQHINTYLTPLVNDLTVLFSGVRFQNASSLLGYTILRATLACITCDLPAMRKVCGFASFNSVFGCSKCMKRFPTLSFGSKPQYAVYDCTMWKKRDIDAHRQKAIDYKHAQTSTERKRILQECGVKYSETILIPGFDVIRCHVIDPMHCLFLGLASVITSSCSKKKLTISFLLQKYDAYLVKLNLDLHHSLLMNGS